MAFYFYLYGNYTSLYFCNNIVTNLCVPSFSFIKTTLYRIPSTSPSPKKASVSSVTTLPSGLTIVTENASLTSTLALTYPNAGSSNEGPSEGGAAIANRYLSFKSGSGLSSALIIRNLEDVGATLFSSAGRRGATVGFTAARENAAFVAPLLVTECSFEKWDVKEAQSLAGIEAGEATSNAQVSYNDLYAYVAARNNVFTLRFLIHKFVGLYQLSIVLGFSHRSNLCSRLWCSIFHRSIILYRRCQPIIYHVLP